MNALTAARHTEGRGKGLRRRTDHALACRSLHVVNAAQVLEVRKSKEEGDRPLTGKTRGPSRSRTVSGWGETSTARRSEERPRRGEVPITDEAGRGRRKRDVVRERSEILRRVVRKTVRISEVDLDGKRTKLTAENELRGEHCGEAATSPARSLKRGKKQKEIATGLCLTHANQCSIRKMTKTLRQRA